MCLNNNNNNMCQIKKKYVAFILHLGVFGVFKFYDMYVLGRPLASRGHKSVSKIGLKQCVTFF